MPWTGIGSAIAGAGIGALGNIASQFMSSEGGIDKGDTRWLWRNQLPYLVDAAKRSGIHPLAALGISPASGVTRPAFKSDALKGMGQDISRAMMAASTANARLARAKAIAIEEDTQARRLSGYARSNQLRLSSQTQIPPPVDTITEEDIFDPPAQAKYIRPQKSLSRRGYELGHQGFEKIAIGEGGYIETAPGEGFEDYISESFPAKLRYEIPKIERAIAGDYYTWKMFTGYRRPAYRRFIIEISKYLRNLEKAHPPGKGWQYVWAPYKGVPRRMRILGGKKNVFDFSKRPWLRTIYR